MTTLNLPIPDSCVGLFTIKLLLYFLCAYIIWFFQLFSSKKKIILRWHTRCVHQTNFFQYFFQCILQLFLL
ncbi:hypothetical protein AAZV13_13G059100 [Glycine max]